MYAPVCVCVCMGMRASVSTLKSAEFLNSDQILHCQYIAYTVRKIKMFIKAKCEPYEAGYNYVNQKTCTLSDPVTL
jgi:hypothetical protein